MLELGLSLDSSELIPHLKSLGYTRIAVKSNSLQKLQQFKGDALKRLEFKANERAPAPKSADLISVLVSNDKEFTNACQNLEVDIITFDMTKRLEFYLRLPNINSALNRGICFEISLGTALRDMSCRPYLVHIGSQLLRATKGKNIIVSGDPRKPLDTRGPLDIMAMLSIFNMNPQQARNSLTVNPESCVMHGYSRSHTFRSLLVIEDKNTDSEPAHKKLKTGSK